MKISGNSSDIGPLTATPQSFYPSLFCTSASDFNFNLDNEYIGQDEILPVELQSFSVY